MPEPFKVCRKLSERMTWLCHVGVTATLSEMRVAIVLAECCNSKTGLAFPSQSLIAKRYQMQRPNVAKAIKLLRDKNFIRRVGSCGQIAQWNLILPLQPVSPEIHPPVSPEILVKPRHIITVVEPVKIKPKTQSPTLHGARTAEGTTPQDAEGWKPARKGKDYFFKNSGLTTEEEFATEVRRFISFNIEKRTSRRVLATKWRGWVDQIRAYKSEQQAKRRNGDNASPSLAEDVARVIKRAGPCWQQFDKDLDPTKDPGLFVRKGCNRFGPCDCDTEKRKAIIKELSP